VDQKTSNSPHRHFKAIFEDAPIAILEIDYSCVVRLKSSLKAQGISTYRTYLRTHRKVTTDTYRQLRIMRLNRAALDLLGAKSKKELSQQFSKTIYKESFGSVVHLLAGLMEGQQQRPFEWKGRNVKGELVELLVRIAIPMKARKSLKGVIVVLEDVSAQKKYERHLKRLAQTDGLTLALNNGSVMERLQEEYLRAQRYKSDMSIMMVDMDHFKAINDRYGHQKGDIVLRNTATHIRENLREVDVIGRYGGDEFIVILPETSSLNAKVAGERLRLIFEKLASANDGGDIFSTVSVGIAGCDSKGVVSVKELIRTADRALYYAKTAGRNKVIVQ
jgi:diguanylate cyclase (GGDEF)-like protein